MKLRQLQTLTAFLERRSFAATGDKVGLTQSAITVQMQRLEAELGVQLFDRSTRPSSLTRHGEAVAEIAAKIVELTEALKLAAITGQIPSTVSLGFVPTTMLMILPRFLHQLRDRYPSMQIEIKSGLSVELASAVLRREIDFALTSLPIAPIAELAVTKVIDEPLYAIGTTSLSHIGTDVGLLSALPFISFSRRTWLGQLIASRLQLRGLSIKTAIEVDSIEAIEQLVAKGLGVSIVPQRLLAPSLSESFTAIPFGSPIETRSLVLVERDETKSSDLSLSVRKIFASL